VIHHLVQQLGRKGEEQTQARLNRNDSVEKEGHRLVRLC